MSTPLRIWEFAGATFVARDDEDGRPEHAVWEDGKVVWKPHPQGGECAPYLGPMEALPR